MNAHFLTSERRQWRAQRVSRGAFTLVELLVVIAIVSLLLVFLVVGAGKLKQQVRLTESMQHQRAITTAFLAYFIDNSGKFAGVDTGVRRHDWVASSVAGNTENGLEVESALTTGALWDYVGDLRVYKSPLDPHSTAQRLRSYSLNGFLASTETAAFWGGPPSAQVMDRMSKVVHPAETLCCVSEYDYRGYNHNGWSIMGNFSYIWIDRLQNWNPGFWEFSYMDGHTEPFRHESNQTDIDYYMNLEEPSFFFETPDYKWLVLHLYPGQDW
ncbi:MAG: prepilin-type N-terminal cleavage/methylation domain-containing protein [Phycisphaerales bacterium]|nr:prepilin-type N-terminal cleavage/methylation domain-containing protein [Phycisphaerales bacterium]